MVYDDEELPPRCPEVRERERAKKNEMGRKGWKEKNREK